MTRTTKLRWTRNDLGYHSEDGRFSIIKDGAYWRLVWLGGSERRISLAAAKEAAAAR